MCRDVWLPWNAAGKIFGQSQGVPPILPDSCARWGASDPAGQLCSVLSVHAALPGCRNGGFEWGI